MALPEPLPPGDRYELRHELGRGSYGVVYEAYDPREGRVVALKVLSDVRAESLRRFKREFRIAREISHPNLAELYELTIRDGAGYMTMELVRGVDFASYVRKHPDALGNSLLSLARGIRALHASGVLHRDLKPSNVLVDEGGRVVLLDFGLAVEMRGDEALLTTPGMPHGTPTYMAPEQAIGKSVTEASDWYALGVMAYQCLAGALPNWSGTGPGGNPLGLMLAKVSNDAPDLTPLAPHAPSELLKLVMELVARDPAQRPRGSEVVSRLGGRADDSTDVTAARQRSHVFVGRVNELGALHAAYERLEDGLSSTVCVRGALGLGKSTLLEQFKTQLSKESEALVLTGRCSPHEAVPFRAFDGVVDQLASEAKLLAAVRAKIVDEDAAALECLFPVLKGRLRARGVPLELPRGPHGRSVAFAAFRTLLFELTKLRRLVLCIEDVHWADADSSALMRALRAVETPLQLLIITTCETPLAATDGLAGELEDGIKNAQVEEVTLHPLSESEAEHLMIALTVRADDETRLLARSARGVPLLLRELARDVRIGRGASLLPKAQAETSNLEQLMRARVAQASFEQTEVLRLIATATAALTTSQLSALMPTLTDMSRALDILAGRGLVERTGDTVSLTLPFLRGWLLADLDAETRRSLHTRVAEVLAEDVATNEAALSYHYRLAERADLARSFASKAARTAASQLAFGQASKLYDDAIRLHGSDTEAARALKTELTDALLGGGSGEAVPVFLPACGDLVGGKYRIGDLLGRGGMGAVFSATHVRTGKQAALKWLLPLKAGEEGAYRFAREAQAAGRIHHPNVVDVYDIGEHEGASFLVMELLHGETLSARLERGRMTAAETLDVMLPVLQGVAAAHAKGVIHRDLKPHNIFLTRSDASSVRVPKVLDFGISKIGETLDGATSDTITREGTVLGTPQYMAPEQLRGVHDVDERADVYSLGVILYVMLTGELPFRGRSHNELVFQVATENPPSPCEVRPEIGRELSRVVMQAMTRDRDQRCRSVHALEQLLARAVELDKAPRPLPRSRSSWLWVAGLAAAGVLSVWILRDGGGERVATPSRARVTKVSAATPGPEQSKVSSTPPAEGAAPVAPTPDIVAPLGSATVEAVPTPKLASPRRGRPRTVVVAPELPAKAAAEPTSRTDNRAGGITLGDF